MSQKQGGMVVLVIMGLIFGIVGYVVAFKFGKPIIEKAKASVDWPVTPGVVEKSEVVRSKDSDGDTQYSADVVYKYSVGGQDYESSTVWFGGDYSSSSSSGFYKVTGRYPVGKEVQVYYNPEEPYVAALEPGAKTSTYMLFWFGLMFLCVGVLMFIGPVIKILFVLLVVATQRR